MGFDDSLDTEDDSFEDWDQEPSLAPCPNCGESIYEDAPQCPECGQYVVFGSTSQNPSGRLSAVTQIVIWILIVALVFPAIWVLFRSG